MQTFSPPSLRPGDQAYHNLLNNQILRQNILVMKKTLHISLVQNVQVKIESHLFCIVWESFCYLLDTICTGILRKQV